MTSGIVYKFRLPTDPTSDYGTCKPLFNNSIKINYKISCPTNSIYLSSIQRNASEGVPFKATPRPKEAWTAVDYAMMALKIIFFPITALYALLCYGCSVIAYRFGVGATGEIDEDLRSELKRMGGEEVSFFAEDMRKLEGMHFANPRPVAGAQTVLICSGSHGSYEKYTVPMVDALLKQGHHVMVFNYRGFGKSKGGPSETGFYLDAEAAYQYLKSVQGRSDDQIAVLGYSMGSGPATDLAAHHKIKLILDRYFSSMKEVATDEGGLPAKVIFHLGGAVFDVKEKIKNVEGRIFLARGASDEMTKPYQLESLKSALAPNPNASFVTVSSSHHHYTNSGLWFHPENTVNAAQRQQLMGFLSSGG